uniref:Apple domain-containing protein n=1 Tax=Trichuris muris TaxID=70415 RepID=A0A5S6R114_TRIMR
MCINALSKGFAASKRSLSGDGCNGYSTFVITTGAFNEGMIREHVNVDSLSECASKCRALASGCQAANFVHQSAEEKPLCVLYQAIPSDLSRGQRISHDSNTLFAIERICLPIQSSALAGSECHNDWWFERVPNKQIAVASLFTLSTLVNLSIEECLSECSKRAHTCKSVQYTKTSKQCSLLSASRATAGQPNGIFISAFDADIYENGCFQWPLVGSRAKCTFRTGYGLAVPALYDERRANVASSQQCQQFCSLSSAHLCTAYAFDTLGRVCYLIHTGNSMEERRVFMQRSMVKDRIRLGRLENCVEFRMNCEAQHMRVDVQILKLVNGEVTSVNDPNRCRVRMINSWTSTLKIPYNGCGTELKDQSSFVNHVAFRPISNSTFDYVRRAKLVCNTPREKESSHNYSLRIASIPVGQAKIVDVTGRAGPRQKEPFRLVVLNQRFKPTSNAVAGDHGFLEVQWHSLHDVAPQKFRVTDLIATDLRSGNDLLLYDNQGCAVHPKLASDFEVIDRYKLRAKISFFAFPETNRVFYKGHVEACYDNCAHLKSGCTRAAKGTSDNKSDLHNAVVRRFNLTTS